MEPEVQKQHEQALADYDQLIGQVVEELAQLDQQETKAGLRRLRKLSLELGKAGAVYRKVSVAYTNSK